MFASSGKDLIAHIKCTRAIRCQGALKIINFSFYTYIYMMSRRTFHHPTTRIRFQYMHHINIHTHQKPPPHHNIQVITQLTVHSDISLINSVHSIMCSCCWVFIHMYIKAMENIGAFFELLEQHIVHMYMMGTHLGGKLEIKCCVYIIIESKVRICILYCMLLHIYIY